MKAPVLTETFSPDRMQMNFDLAGIDAVIAKLLAEKSSEKSSEKSLGKTASRIVEIIRKNPQISAASMAQKLSLTSRAVEKHLAALQIKGKILRVGADNGGCWKIPDESFKAKRKGGRPVNPNSKRQQRLAKREI